MIRIAPKKLLIAGAALFVVAGLTLGVIAYAKASKVIGKVTAGFWLGQGKALKHLIPTALTIFSSESQSTKKLKLELKILQK